MEALQTTTDQSEEQVPASSRQMTIMVVDDHRANLEMVSYIMKPLGHTTLLVESGQEALRLINNTLPDLILLDIMMPGMNGYELCIHLKKMPETRNIPIIFLTALKEVRDETKGLELGAVDFISKPFNSS